MMKVILREDVPHLGVVGDLVAVKDGYGRNFLIPQGKAIHASPRSVRELEHQKRLAAHHREQATAQARTDKEKIEALSICITRKIAPPPLNEDHEPVVETLPKLFGSVTNRDLAAVLRGAGFKVDRQRVTLGQHVGTVGKFESTIRLNGGIRAALPFWVIPEGSEDVEAAKKAVEAQQVKKQEEDAAALEASKAKPAEPEAEAAAPEAGEDGEAAPEGDAPEAEVQA